MPFKVREGQVSLSTLLSTLVAWGGGGGGKGHFIVNCNMTGRGPFFKNLHSLFRKKNCISIPYFGIIRLENNRANNGLLFLNKYS